MLMLIPVTSIILVGGGCSPVGLWWLYGGGGGGDGGGGGGCGVAIGTTDLGGGKTATHVLCDED